jgi:hypothetical protein
MKTVTIKGVSVKVVEHMKEIGDNCANDNLFKRWYNKSQFFKAIIGEELDNGGMLDEYATYLGGLSGENSHYCWYIELYDIENSSAKDIKELASEVRDDLPCWSSCFFIEDKNGKVYFVATDED